MHCLLSIRIRHRRTGSLHWLRTASRVIIITCAVPFAASAFAKHPVRAVADGAQHSNADDHADNHFHTAGIFAVGFRVRFFIAPENIRNRPGDTTGGH